MEAAPAAPEHAAARAGLPRWAWAIAAMLFPVGPFLALGAEKALSWPRATLYSILACAPMVPMALVMMLFDREGRRDNDPLRLTVLATWAACYIAVGWIQYRIGLGARCWSDVGRRIWRIVGVAACSILALDVLVILLTVIFLLPKIAWRHP